MNRASIEDLWSRLDPTTQEWLRANPGSAILPRTVTEALLQASGRHEDLEGTDRNGQLPLSARDRAFIQAMAEAAPAGHPVPPGAPPA
ncbi:MULTISPECIES: hypothetical protein [Arthrobacter]|nr:MULTISPECIES: hypothetical protein [Arthrobacter]QYF90462.1 hypothetical protein KY499_03905 [Arthrobacter sp. PAMC25284]